MRCYTHPELSYNTLFVIFTALVPADSSYCDAGCSDGSSGETCGSSNHQYISVIRAGTGGAAGEVMTTSTEGFSISVEKCHNSSICLIFIILFPV